MDKRVRATMNKIIYVPLEHIDGRYTVHMDRDIEAYLQNTGKEYVKIMPIRGESPPPPKGQFLNAPFTSRFKALQLAKIASMYERNEIEDGDSFFFSDIWFPGIESIAYMNYFTKKDVKITGIIHAGSFTDTDFVRDMERWAKNFEDIIFDIADKIFCASEFIKADIVKKRIVNPDKLIVTGLPVDQIGLEPYMGTEKENIVIFNGRLCDEKQPWLFDELERQLLDCDIGAKCIKTQDLKLDRKGYYKLLAKSKVVVSYALQENFGFGVAEAAYLGCTPIVPNRLVYPELYPKENLFNTFEESVDMVYDALINYKQNQFKLKINCFEKWFN